MFMVNKTNKRILMMCLINANANDCEENFALKSLDSYF